MTIKESVEDYLRAEPKFRERKNKDRGMVNMLMKRYGGLNEVIVAGVLSKDAIIAIVQDYATMDRSWRQALEHNPDLRGTDYDEKVRLEQEKQLELGYSPGHLADVKKLQTL